MNKLLFLIFEHLSFVKNASTSSFYPEHEIIYKEENFKALVIYDIIPDCFLSEKEKKCNIEYSEELLFFDYLVAKENINQYIESYLERKRGLCWFLYEYHRYTIFDIILDSLDEFIQFKVVDFDAKYFSRLFKMYTYYNITDNKALEINIGEISYSYYKKLNNSAVYFYLHENKPLLDSMIKNMFYSYYHFIKFHNEHYFNLLFPSFLQIDYSNTYFTNLPIIDKKLKKYKMTGETQCSFIYGYNFENMTQNMACYLIENNDQEDHLILINFTSIHFIYKHLKKLYYGILNKKELIKLEKKGLGNENNVIEERRLLEKLQELIYEILTCTINSTDNVVIYLNDIKENLRKYKRIILCTNTNKILNQYWGLNFSKRDSIIDFIMKNIFDAYYEVFCSLLTPPKNENSSEDDDENLKEDDDENLKEDDDENLKEDDDENLKEDDDENLKEDMETNE